MKKYLSPKYLGAGVVAWWIISDPHGAAAQARRMFSTLGSWADSVTTFMTGLGM